MIVNIVFDIGNVLIQWHPERAVSHVFPDPDEALAYLRSVGFAQWNRIQDGGRSFADGWAALDAAHRALAGPLDEYPARFAETIRDPIVGTWALLDRLAARGHRLFAITNFAAYTWPVALNLHPRLTQVFEGVIVSGHERLLKPDPEIYRLLLTRHALIAGDCLFIDDSAANVAGGRAVGMKGHHFTTPPALEVELLALGLL